MLVLSRNTSEEIVLVTPEGHEIVVMPVETRGDRVRLGITADKSIKIHRREVYDAIQAEQQELQPSAA